MKARNIIGEDESAVVILTDGHNFKTFEGGFAITGDLIISDNLTVDKAIIYKRDKTSNRTDVFLAKPIDIFPGKTFRRYDVRLWDVNFVGTTETDWCEFTDSKKGARNPIKYINKENQKSAKDSLLSLS